MNALGAGYFVDTSWSKSGNFIIYDWMWEDKWLGIDLNNNETYDDRYYVLLADNQTSGIYDTVIVSNTTNFTANGINATAGTAVQFGGTPIYLINSFYEAGTYVLRFSSMRIGWEGMWLGTFQAGKVANIPFLVTTPGGAPIPGAFVEIDGLTWHGPFPMVHISDVNNTTDSYGLAILHLNTSDIETGQWLIHYNVTLPASYDNQSISPSLEEKWRLPGMEIRAFRADGELGVPGRITLNRLSVADDNMVIYYGEELEAYGGFGGHYTGITNVSWIDWPFDNVFYNATNNTFYNRKEGNFVNPMLPNTVNLTRGGMNITYNFTHRYLEGHNVTIAGAGNSSDFCNYWNITATGFGNDSSDYVNLSVSYTPYPWSVEHPEMHSMMHAGAMIHGVGRSNFNVSYVNNSTQTVTIELIDDRWIAHINDMAELMDGEPSNGELRGAMITVADVPGANIRLYTYNNVSRTSQEEFWDWSPTFDTILVVNATGNYTKGIGETIPDLDDYYVAMAPKWGGRIITVNSSFTKIYPLSDWAPDGDIYYVGRFSEEDVGTDIDYDGKINATPIYRMMLFDHNPNGIYYPTSGQYDNDNDFTDVWGQNESTDMWEPYDMYGEEGGPLVREWPEGPPTKMGERWVQIGSIWGRDFGVPSMDINETTGTANLTTFIQKWYYTTDENITIWVKAREFDNRPVTGTISVDELIVIFDFKMTEIEEMHEEPPMGPPEVIIGIAENATMVNGEGTLIIANTTLQDKVGTFDVGEFIIRINVTASDGRSEILERYFMVFSPEFIQFAEEEGLER